MAKTKKYIVVVREVTDEKLELKDCPITDICYFKGYGKDIIVSSFKNCLMLSAGYQEPGRRVDWHW